MTDTLTGIVADLPEEAYFASPALSSTGARLILDSPARFHYRQTHPEPITRAFDVGSAVHAKVLGVGAAIAVIPDEILASNGAASTASAKAFIEDARAAGLTPVKAAVAEEIDAMSEAALTHPTARALFEQPGIPEASLFATDPETGVEIRARFDFWAPISVDLKTTATLASKSGFEKAVANHGYDVQQEHYGDTEKLITGERRPFVFVVVEKTPPYLVGVHQLDREFVEIGRKKAARARRIFAECTASGVWPGYPPEVQLLSPPLYHVYDFQENHES
jgi:hypothetical protein